MATKLKVITPADLGKGINFNTKTDQWEVEIPEQSSGLDCAAIKKLPEREWSKGTTVLAQTEAGECYRLTTYDNIVADVGVAFSASRRSGYVGEEYRVTATVTNTGAATVESQLLLVKPEGSDYTIKDWQTSGSSNVVIEKNSELDYTIKGLGTAKRATVSFTVVPSAHGTLQFGATVTTKGFDVSASNNRDSIILSANTKTDPNYVPTVDCPAITVTDVATGQALRLYPTTTSGSTVKFAPLYDNANAQKGAINYITADSLNGRKLTLTGASTVAVYRLSNLYSGYLNLYGPVLVADGDLYMSMQLDGRVDTNNIPTGTNYDITGTVNISDNYSFDGTTLTLGATAIGYDPVLIAMRPAGDNCNWQCVYLAPKYKVAVPTKTITVQGLEEQTYTKQSGYFYSGKPLQKSTTYSTVNFIGDQPASVLNLSGSDHSGSLDRLTKEEAVVINLPRNTAKTFTIQVSEDSSEIRDTTKGAVAVTPNGKTATVVVSNTAQPTDSITFYNGRITINII